MLGTKILVVFGSCIYGSILVVSQPTLAVTTQTMDPLSAWAQLGVCGMFGTILMWVLARTIPTLVEKNTQAMVQMSIKHSEAIEKTGMNTKDGLHELATEVKHLGDSVESNMKQQISMLHKALTS